MSPVTKMAEHKVSSFAPIVALWTVAVTLPMMVIRILLQSKKIMPFWLLCCETEAILSKKFRFGHPG